ncbi:MAG: hypothetical protein ACKV22_40885 [Bryobacteraceae bacterium]
MDIARKISTPLTIARATALPAAVPPTPVPTPGPPPASEAARFAVDGALLRAAAVAGRTVSTTLTRYVPLGKQAKTTPAGVNRPGAAAPSVEIGSAAITSNLVDRARAAGLSDFEAQKLESILTDSKDFAADSKLVNNLLGTQNAARALRTFNDLDVYRSQNGDRITPEIVKTLAMGVGRSRTSASQGREGILGNEQAINAAEALVAMPQADYDLIQSALPKGKKFPGSQSDPQVEGALILKSVAARKERLRDFTAWNATSMPSPAANEIAGFANTIRGRNVNDLIQRTSVMDLDGDFRDEALQQKWNNSCVQASLQIAQAEADPIYAWQLHNDTIHNTATTGAIADEQKAGLTAFNGMAVARGANGGVGTDINVIESSMDGKISPVTGRAYEHKLVVGSPAGRGQALDHIALLAKTGTDVPIGVTWSFGVGADGKIKQTSGHALVVTDVQGSGNTQQFLITDPWTGRTGWISRNDIISGKTNFFAGTGMLTDYWW